MSKTRNLLYLLIIFFLITACTPNKSEEDKSIHSWIDNTINIFNESYTDIGSAGGFVQKPFVSSETTDIVNTTWYLETLFNLNYPLNNFVNKVERNQELVELLESYKKENRISLAYTYWAILNIYNKLEIDVPKNLIQEVKLYISLNSDKNGFALSEDQGLNLTEITVLYCKIYSLINEPYTINHKELNTRLSKAIKQNDVSTVLQLNNISFLLNYTNSSIENSTKEYIKNYMRGNEYTRRKNNITEISLFLPYLEREGIDPEISQEQKNKYVQNFRDNIKNKQGIAGKLMYDYVRFLSDSDRKHAIEYIKGSMNTEGFWSSTKLRIPNIRDTNTSLMMYSLLNVSVKAEWLHKIKNLYEKKLDTANIHELVGLMGVKMFFENNNISLANINTTSFLNSFKKETIENQAKIYTDMVLLYRFYYSEYDVLINDMESVLLKTEVDLGKFTKEHDMKSVVGLLICYYNNDRISNDKLIKYLDHFRKTDGYALNPHIQYADIIGTYLAVNVHDITNTEFPNSLKKSVSLYRRDQGGYSFFVTDPSTYNFDSSFMGFDAEKKIIDASH